MREGPEISIDTFGAELYFIPQIHLIVSRQLYLGDWYLLGSGPNSLSRRLGAAVPRHTHRCSDPHFCDTNLKASIYRYNANSTDSFLPPNHEWNII